MDFTLPGLLKPEHLCRYETGIMIDVHNFYVRFMGALFRLKYGLCLLLSEIIEDLTSRPEDGGQIHSSNKINSIETWYT